jgi:DMSO/TMAO reductase YedYZ heme-binding membrane subunit
MPRSKPDTTGVAAAQIGAFVAAAVILLVPATAWMTESAHLYGMELGAAFLGIYLPARLLALMALVLMLFQFVLSARIPLIEKLFKRSSLLKTHRNAGKIAYVMALLHGVGMLLFDLITAGEIYLYTETTIGLVALVLLTAAVIAAWFFKPLRVSLKTWRRIHLLTYIVFPLVVWHALMLGSTVNAVAAVRILFIALLVVYALVVVYRLFRVVSESRRA